MDTEYKLCFKVVDDKKHEELSIHINDNTNIIFKEIFPKTLLNNGNSVRVLIKG